MLRFTRNRRKKLSQILLQVTCNNETLIGYICQISFRPSKLLPILIVPKNVFQKIYENELKDVKIELNDNSNHKYSIEMGKNRIYFSDEYITIIEIKKEDGIIIDNYLTVANSYENQIFI